MGLQGNCVRTPSAVSGHGYSLQTAHPESQRWGDFPRKPASHPNWGSGRTVTSRSDIGNGCIKLATTNSFCGHIGDISKQGVPPCVSFYLFPPLLSWTLGRGAHTTIYPRHTPATTTTANVFSLQCHRLHSMAHKTHYNRTLADGTHCPPRRTVVIGASFGAGSKGTGELPSGVEVGIPSIVRLFFRHMTCPRRSLTH